MTEPETTPRPKHFRRMERKMDDPPLPIKKTEVDYDTRKKIQEKVGAELMDMDSLTKNVFGTMPSTSSEMMYRMQINMNVKIHAVFMVIGILMVLAVIITL